MCDNSHLSLEFITRKPDGMLLYNGPIVPPETDEVLVSGITCFNLFMLIFSEIWIFIYTILFTLQILFL